MRHHVTRFLVALQFVLSCGGLSAQDTALPQTRPKASPIRLLQPAAGPTARRPAEDLSVMLMRRIVMAPGYLRSVIRLAPSPDNRVLRVTIDSPDFYRSSEIQLDGAGAPMSHFIDWKQMPVGEYEMRATLIGPEGTRAERLTSFRVVGPILARRCC